MSEIISQYGSIFLILACVFGFFMAWGVGANDVANAMGTSVGAKAITIKQAILIAMVFEFAGAYFAGGEVTSTIRSGIIDIEKAGFADSPELLVYGMLSSLLAAGIWLLVASHNGWPVSTTHSIIGAIVGFAVVGISRDAVVWSKVWEIVASWVVSPMVSGILAFFIFRSVQKLILDTENPFANAKKYVPFYIFLVGFAIAMVTMVKGLRHVGLDFSFGESVVMALGCGVLAMLLGVFMMRSIKDVPGADKDFHFTNVERLFGVLMIFTACSMAFAHGSNDVANAIGPLAAIVGVVQSGGVFVEESALPFWILLLGGAGIVTGLAMWGYKVIATIGRNITELTPSRGFAAELAAATTVVVASGTGIPVSTTHTLVGAVLGVGIARGIGALNLGVVGRIFLSWVVTLPVGAGISIVFFFLFKGIFG
ncbi:MAG: inorganic phosphate transporter [Gammaproteobacteria bacterium]|jgi:PiT family inorganic phosphate transporter|nr:inorganic phosphate transporter [Gammaproteobacteria bacterium]MBT3859593.1 inorganic phosphate transporter [Gammaproteobacteria bacterium]MBT3986513.1 inorganic phosphate transporter [Gammaproteobacteria bacterium]MBT4581143.1 inorganic phosphate transporter [Gammaproteobacteria bacterium]MBT4660060.1 inorganic phosphate transporter [Gammaproteobacteria bacterium]